MAEDPCKNCQHYDVIKKAKSDTRRGWCAAQSKYPAREMPGQTFPPNVARVAPGELAKPVIVTGNDIVPHCNLFRRKR